MARMARKRVKWTYPVYFCTKQVILQHAETEVRLEQDPFPLYPGEELEQPVKPLTVVPALQALRLKVVRGFQDENLKIERIGVC